MKVAVGVIVDDQQRILITQRPLHATHGGLWEFPGGKVEDNEASLDALKRELMEEVGLEVLSAEFLGEISHHYANGLVELMVYCVHAFQGHGHAMENQMDLCWVKLECLHEFNFPEANQQIIELYCAQKCA